MLLGRINNLIFNLVLIFVGQNVDGYEKNLLLLFFLVILLASCLGYKELPVEYDYSYKGNFKKYGRIDIMKPAGPSRLNDDQ